MTKYHVNPDTNRVNICRAEIQCKFVDDAGDAVPHFFTKEEAHTYKEQKLKEELGAFSTVSKPKRAKKKIRTLTEEENIELTKRLVDEFNETYESLSDKEQSSIDYYTFCGSSSMNRLLHGTPREDEEVSAESTMKHIKNLDSAINKHYENNKGEKKTLYRYLSLDKNTDVNEFIKEHFQEGGEYSDTGFMSTTEDIAFIAGYAKKHSRNRKFVILEIETDKGISVQKDEERIGNIQSFEKERLLPRDMKFTVDEIFESSVKIDESREKVHKQFGSNGYMPSEYTNFIPAKRFNFIKLTEQENKENKDD